ncbi:hypothetical protein HZY97_19785 [Sphingomonas sp. R-74633]|uniref:hypothetical protein n=1 Tax=Sphingomonas sp. R-74633 TaxID=2751188 RepID=UPI0015D14EAD|nr:hypothetical protein [Sphingomonas sp. R-74633]NYT43025.1 hypothetical protein [Sphingomonas sp. R-74633]
MIASSAPTVVGALAVRARRKIRAHFFVLHAVTAEEAVPFVPQRRIEQTQFDRMLRAGIVREAGKGRYWFDIVAWQKHQDRTRMILVPIVIAVCVLVAGLITLLY